MSEPSPENYARAMAVLNDARFNLPPAIYGSTLRQLAAAIDAAELRGHTRAVEEIVTWLRATARSDVALCGDMTAGSGAMLHAAILIERGEHREETTP